MIRIGIITLIDPNNDNYGACLQAFALKVAIKKVCIQQNINSETICLPYYDEMDMPLTALDVARRKYLNNKFNLFRFIFKFLKLVAIESNKKRTKRMLSFRDFREKITNNLEACPDYNNLIKFDCNLYVIGSDQVWNTTKGIGNKGYWGEIKQKNKDIKIVSYAASFGNVMPTNNLTKEIKNYLINFNLLSVREQHAKEYIVKKLCFSETAVSVNIDPSLLLNSDDYKEISCNSICEANKYVLIYLTGANKKNKVLSLAKKIAKANNYKIIIVNKPSVVYFFEVIFNSNIIYKYDAGPSEFVSLVKNAEYVITNSFHGTAFSLIFKKRFTVFEKKNKDLRLRELLKLLHIPDYKVIEIENALTSEDWNLIYQELQKQKIRGYDYILESLKLVIN